MPWLCYDRVSPPLRSWANTSLICFILVAMRLCDRWSQGASLHKPNAHEDAGPSARAMAKPSAAGNASMMGVRSAGSSPDSAGSSAIV